MKKRTRVHCPVEVSFSEYIGDINALLGEIRREFEFRIKHQCMCNTDEAMEAKITDFFNNHEGY